MGWTPEEESWFESRQEQGVLFFSKATRPAFRPTQPRVHWATRAHPPGVKAARA
jgi:hypothetical protein